MSDLRSKLALVVAGLAVLAAVGLVVGRCGRSADAQVKAGERHLRANRLVEAEQAFERALLIDPRDARAIYGKGWAFYLSGHPDLQPAARQLFQRAIDYEPDFYGGYRGLGVLLLEEGKVLPAERYLRQAWDRAPDEPSVLMSLGQLYLRAERFAEAEQVFEAAVQAAPGRGELRRFVADVSLRRGDHDTALEQIQLGRDSSVSGQRGLYLLDEGEALIRLDRASRLVASAQDPADPRLSDALQEVQRADSLLMEASAKGFENEALQVREGVLEPLRRRLLEKQGAP